MKYKNIKKFFKINVIKHQLSNKQIQHEVMTNDVYQVPENIDITIIIIQWGWVHENRNLIKNKVDY
jgi:hypothetical protein